MTVFREGEIELNGVKYPLGGDKKVHIVSASHFAQKQVIGDYTLDSDPERSTWPVYYDQTGGIGIENFKRQGESNRSFWANIIAEYPCTGTLPLLATSVAVDTYPGHLQNGGFENWTAGAADNWTEYDTGAFLSIAQNTAEEDSGSSCAAITAANGSVLGTNYYYQSISWNNNYRGKIVVFTIKVKDNQVGTAASHAVRVTVLDGIGSTATAATQTSNAGYTSLSVTHTVDNAATELTVRLEVANSTGGNVIFYWDTGYWKVPYNDGNWKMVDFNSNIYMKNGNNLYKLNTTTGASWTLVEFFKDVITDIIASVGSCLYIFLGDSVFYQYMSTADAFTETDSTAAYYGIHNAAVLFKINSSGTFAKCTTPNAASPSWTSRATFDTGSFGTILRLRTYADINDADAVYLSSTKGLFQFDDTNNKWLNTECQFPQHTDNGKGLAVQNGVLNYSAGLSVWTYAISDGVKISNVGLDSDDGIPDSYVGSITDMCAGYYGDLYVTLDASLISSSNSSSVLKRDKKGAWHVIWVDGTANQTLDHVFVSSVYDYRLWFVSNETPYYITLDRARRNPTKKTTSYAASGIYLSPWEDNLWPVGNKLAIVTKALARGTTADEKVTIKYRLDKAYTDLDSGWTTHDTLVLADAGVESVVKFGSSAGVLYKQIQFRLDFVRAAGTATNTPNLIYLLLEYRKVLSPKWGWGFIVDCTQKYNKNSATVLLDNLITAAETQTMVTFTYRDVTKYVTVRLAPEGERTTGDMPTGQYSVVVTEG